MEPILLELAALYPAFKEYGQGALLFADPMSLDIIRQRLVRGTYYRSGDDVESEIRMLALNTLQ